MLCCRRSGDGAAAATAAACLRTLLAQRSAALQQLLLRALLPQLQPACAAAEPAQALAVLDALLASVPVAAPGTAADDVAQQAGHGQPACSLSREQLAEVAQAAYALVACDKQAEGGSHAAAAGSAGGGSGGGSRRPPRKGADGASASSSVQQARDAQAQAHAEVWGRAMELWSGAMLASVQAGSGSGSRSGGGNGLAAISQGLQQAQALLSTNAHAAGSAEKAPEADSGRALALGSRQVCQVLAVLSSLLGSAASHSSAAPAGGPGGQGHGHPAAAAAVGAKPTPPSNAVLPAAALSSALQAVRPLLDSPHSDVRLAAAKAAGAALAAAAGTGAGGARQQDQLQPLHAAIQALLLVRR